MLGHDPATATEDWRARVGVVLQSWRDHPRWTPRVLLGYLGRYYAPYSVPERHRPFDTEELIDLVGLGQHADQKIRTLSGGERRRLDLAVGIIGRPELLFLDEPTAGFDPQARRDFHDLVHRLSDLEDTTILLTTHDLDEADKLADRILILAGGRIVADGSADELARRVTREAQVRWSRNGEQFVHATPDATSFVRELLAQHDDVTDLEVRRATLEDTYIAMVQQYESGVGDGAAVDPRGGDPMTPVRNAVRSGFYRGWTEFMQGLRSPQDQGFFLFMALAVLGYLFLNRNDTVEFAGTSLSFPDGGACPASSVAWSPSG